MQLVSFVRARAVLSQAILAKMVEHMWLGQEPASSATSALLFIWKVSLMMCEMKSNHTAQHIALQEGSGRSEQAETGRRPPSVLHKAVARTCAWAQCLAELFHRNGN